MNFLKEDLTWMFFFVLYDKRPSISTISEIVVCIVFQFDGWLVVLRFKATFRVQSRILSEWASGPSIF